MEDFDELMQMPGVMAVGEFTTEGKMIRRIGDMSEDVMKLAAQMCARNNQLLGIQANEFSKVSEMEWFPLVGWCVWAGKYTVMVIGKLGVFVEAESADFNRLVTMLMKFNNRSNQEKDANN